MTVPPCVFVRLRCIVKPLKLPIGLVVKRNMKINSLCYVAYASPVMCRIVPYTRIDFAKYCVMKIEELKKNILLTIKYTKRTDYLIYPKDVWRKLEKRYLKPLSEYKPPKEPGILLYGAPGTGKTSFAEHMADILGIIQIWVNSNDVLDPYVGESERKLSEKFDMAEATQPSALIFDDGEYLFKGRKLTGSGRDAGARTIGSMFQIVLRRMQEWKNKGVKSVIVLTTNQDPRTLDDALIRSGRFGREPIFVPLPNYEAIYTYLKLHGIEDMLGAKKTEELAKRMLNAGLSMADVRGIVMDLLEGTPLEQINIEAKSGKGYRRPIPSFLVDSTEQLFKLIDNRIVNPEKVFSNPMTRLMILLPSNVAEAIAIQYLVANKYPAVLVDDERYIDEAIYTAENTKGVLVLSGEMLDKSILVHAYKKARIPIIYLGTTYLPNNLPVKIILSKEMIVEQNQRISMLKVVLSYYGVLFPENYMEYLRQINSKTSSIDKLIDWLNEVGSFGRSLTLEELTKEYLTKATGLKYI